MGLAPCEGTAPAPPLLPHPPGLPQGSQPSREVPVSLPSAHPTSKAHRELGLRSEAQPLTQNGESELVLRPGIQTHDLELSLNQTPTGQESQVGDQQPPQDLPDSPLPFLRGHFSFLLSKGASSLPSSPLKISLCFLPGFSQPSLSVWPRGGNEGLLLGLRLSTTQGPGQSRHCPALSPSAHLSQPKHSTCCGSERIGGEVGQQRADRAQPGCSPCSQPSTTTERSHRPQPPHPSNGFVSHGSEKVFCYLQGSVSFPRATWVTVPFTIAATNPTFLPTTSHCPLPWGLRAAVLP